MRLNLLILSILFVANISARPVEQRVDYIRVPELTQLNTKTPIFSWQLDNRTNLQQGYRLLVSTDERCSEGDMWDSGDVESPNNFAVRYEGRELESGVRYYWRVMYRGESGRMSRPSQVQSFVVGADMGSIVTDNPLLTRRDRPVEMSSLGGGEYLFDFGRAAFGTLNFEMKVVEDATIVVRLGEQLTAEGRIERKPQGTIRYQEVKVKLKKGQSLYDVVLSKNSRNTGSMAIPVPKEWGVIMPFRYIEVSQLGGNDVKDLKPKRVVMYGYREPLGSFESSNKLLDSIWEISRYTIEATDFLGYYIDGDRERIPYEADAYLNQLSHYCVDSEYAIAKKSLEYFMSHATWPTEWLLHTVMIAYQDYIYTGDTRLIEQYYELIKAKTLHALGREDGLINAKSEVVTPEYLESIGFKAGFKKMEDIVDWPKAAFTKGGMEVGERDGHEMMPINTVVNCFHYHAVKIMGEMADVVGREADAELFAQLASKVRTSINEKLFDRERGVYIDGEGSMHSSLHSNMVAIAFDVVEPEHVGSVVEFVKSRGMACSVYGAQYLFEALYKAGEAEYALELMTNRSDRGWYNMIKIGSTMTLEAWDIKYKSNLDWNHAWGAAPANIIPRYMWGIVPTEPGYTAARIKPQLVGLTQSEISVPTLQGVIRCSYTLLDDGTKRYEIYIPANMSVKFESIEDGSVIDLKRGRNIINLH